MSGNNLKLSFCHATRESRDAKTQSPLRKTCALILNGLFFRGPTSSFYSAFWTCQIRDACRSSPYKATLPPSSDIPLYIPHCLSSQWLHPPPAPTHMDWRHATTWKYDKVSAEGTKATGHSEEKRHKRDDCRVAARAAVVFVAFLAPGSRRLECSSVVHAVRGREGRAAVRSCAGVFWACEDVCMYTPAIGKLIENAAWWFLRWDAAIVMHNASSTPIWI